MYEGQRPIPPLFNERTALILKDISGHQFVDLVVASGEG
jgi:hypothetical protein